MKLLLYAGEDQTGKRLKKCIHHLVPHKALETCGTIVNLIERLRQPVGDLALSVLLIRGQMELKRIIAFGDLLDDIKIIIILPDRRPETISEAHRLYPRFISYADGDFRDIVEVAEHMLGRTHRQT